MVPKDRQVTRLGYVLSGILGGGLTFALTRLGISLLGSLHTLIRVDGPQGVWRDFVTILLHKPELSFMDTFCGIAGMITALVAYMVQPTARYRLYLTFWIPIASLLYITPKIVVVFSIPKHFSNEPQNVIGELLWLNIYFLFFHLISFVLSLIIVEWLFRKYHLLVNTVGELLTEDLQ